MSHPLLLQRPLRHHHSLVGVRMSDGSHVSLSIALSWPAGRRCSSGCYDCYAGHCFSMHRGVSEASVFVCSGSSTSSAGRCGNMINRRTRYMLVCVDAPALHAFCVYIGTETRDFAWIRAPMHVSTKTHVSEFLAVTHMILKSDLRKWVVLYPLVPSAPSHTSFFMIYRR